MGTMGMAGISFLATIWLQFDGDGSIATMELHEEMEAVRREVILEAGREDVWGLVASAEGLRHWLADDVDLPAVRPGAEGTVRDGDQTRLVIVEEVEEQRRVALTWCAPGGEPSLVEMTLDDDDDGDGRTRLVVVELRLATLRAATRRLPVARSATRPRGPQMALAGG
jgi:uncharacterized protein YndB with AHSA1/START domain